MTRARPPGSCQPFSVTRLLHPVTFPSVTPARCAGQPKGAEMSARPLSAPQPTPRRPSPNLAPPGWTPCSHPSGSLSSLASTCSRSSPPSSGARPRPSQQQQQQHAHLQPTSSSCSSLRRARRRRPGGHRCARPTAPYSRASRRSSTGLWTRACARRASTSRTVRRPASLAFPCPCSARRLRPTASLS